MRNAQIGLAQAWARADGDGRDGGVDESQDGNVSPGGSGKDGDADRSSLAAEKDIATARLRRQANDRYFARVSQGVTDVVGKLDEVATAMGKVEMESRSVWSDDEDSETGSQTAETNDAIAGKKETGSQTTGTNDANTGKNGTGNKDKPKK